MTTIESLRKQWKKMVSKYSEVETVIDNTFYQIKNSYNASNRSYHNLDHIQAMLREVKKFKRDLDDYDSILIAIWFHDIVYDVKRSDNEERSAEIVEGFLKKINFSSEKINKIKNLILATKDHSDIDSDEGYSTKLFLDLDLVILGVNREVYQKYAEGIRKEYSFVPNSVYIPERIRILEGFLYQKHIFKTEQLRTLYENNARENIEFEIGQLQNLKI